MTQSNMTIQQGTTHDDHFFVTLSMYIKLVQQSFHTKTHDNIIVPLCDIRNEIQTTADFERREREMDKLFQSTPRTADQQKK
jgi:hypothetical protein